MTTKDFTANVISATKVVPDGNFKDSKASGIWDINEALDLIKGGNWPNAANINPSAFVDALFQTHLYDGNGGTQTITNNINLSGSGGLVWAKRRDSSTNGDHTLVDSARGVTKRIRSNNNQEEYTVSDSVTAFTSSGFSIGADASINTNGAEYVGWTFRKQPKFFDVVTYTGNGTAGRTVAHNLGLVPGMIIVKKTNSTGKWRVYHRGQHASNPEEYVLRLDTTSAQGDNTTMWNDTAPTDSVFTLGDSDDVNENSSTFVAYLFAHNNDDGGFGEPEDHDIIKCASYTSDGGTGTEINVGFEPQFLMIKNISDTGDWMVFDAMRGVVNSAYPNLDNTLFWNLDNAERTNTGYIGFTPTGFVHQGASGDTNTNLDVYIYMAIRRGGMQTPTAASDVFAVAARTGASGNQGAYRSGFPVDMAFHKVITNSINPYEIGSRITQGRSFNTTDTSAEATQSDQQYDYMDGWNSEGSSSSTKYAWMWKRARGFFDVLAYTGTGSATTVTHNLGVVPEMIWVKCRSHAVDWAVYHKDLSAGQYVMLNKTNAVDTNSAYFTTTTPTSSVFSIGVGEYTNQATDRTYVAYLFATVAGVSKVGSFTQSGATNVACGFSGDTPSFILLKRTDSTGDWLTFDSARGIVAGNDSSLDLNNTDAAVTNADVVDPYSGGFATTSTLTNGDYIFYAIAATS